MSLGPLSIVPSHRQLVLAVVSCPWPFGLIVICVHCPLRPRSPLCIVCFAHSFLCPSSSLTVVSFGHSLLCPYSPLPIVSFYKPWSPLSIISFSHSPLRPCSFASIFLCVRIPLCPSSCTLRSAGAVIIPTSHGHQCSMTSRTRLVMHCDFASRVRKRSPPSGASWCRS